METAFGESEKADIICVDETQRLYKNSLEIIIDAFEKKIIRGCVFTYDFQQILSVKEFQYNNPKRLREITGFTEEKMTEKIRTNKEIYSFIRNMLRLYDKPSEKTEYKNIDILYANNTEESDEIIKYYQKNAYVFIAFTPSRYYANKMYQEQGKSFALLCSKIRNCLKCCSR